MSRYIDNNALYKILQDGINKTRMNIPLRSVVSGCIQGRNLRGYVGEPLPNPPTSKNFPFRRAKVVVKCTSARQLTGQRTIGELLLLQKRRQKQKYSQETSDTAQKFSEPTSLVVLAAVPYNGAFYLFQCLPMLL